MFNYMRFRFTLVFMGLALGPIILIAAVIGRYSFTTLEQQSLALQQGIASGVCTEINAFINGRKDELVFLDKSTDFTTLDLAHQRKLLNNLLLQQKDYQELILLDMQGREQIHLSRSGVILESELNSRYTDIEFTAPINSYDVYFGPVRFDEVIREPLMTISVPLIDLREQEVVAVLVAELRLKSVWNLLATIELQNEEVYVLDQSGRIIAHKNPAIVLRGTTVNLPNHDGRATGLSGENVISARDIIQLGDQELIIVAEQPISKAQELAINVVRATVIVTVIAFIVAIILAVIMVRQMVQPIEDLAKSARAISNGDFSLRVKVPGRDEVGQLAVVFNQMATDLERSYAEINVHAIKLQEQNEQLQQKTIALTATNDQMLAEIHIREQTEANLQASNQQLSDTLAELRETQEKMMQQERLAVVGQLAAGIAHDFNNILTTIMGLGELLQRSPKTPNSMQPSLEKIAVSSQRAADLVRQLLDFSRKTIRQPKQLELTSFINESAIFLEHTIPENIQIIFDYAIENDLIEADPTQLQQAIINLAINARDAMPDGGTLTIRLSEIEGMGAELCAGCGEMIIGKWACITVTDTGCGISPESLPHIFEPFFTSKGVGKGTGLGLAQVYGIVKQHAGHITVHSQAAHGTQFAIYLPLLNRTVRTEKMPEMPQLISGHGRTILLVEDDPAVREVSQTMLETLHFTVLTATNGREALTVFNEQKDEISLILSDAMMPEMNGAELFHSVKKQNPAMRIIIMSGYPTTEIDTELFTQGNVIWLQKPISFAKLSEAIGQVLKKNSRILA